MTDSDKLTKAHETKKKWPHLLYMNPGALHFSSSSAGSYTAIALEADYHLLWWHLQQSYCEGATTVGALGCPVRYLTALLAAHVHAAEINLVSAQRVLRITHVWEDKQCVWYLKYDTLKALITSLEMQSTVPALLIQVLEAGEAKWLESDMHNYAHLLRVAVPRNPAFLSVKATLKHLAAYTAEFAPLEALDELVSYLLATVTPFEMLSAEQLRLAAASNQDALQAAQALFRKQQKETLTFTTARPALVQILCDAITRTGKRHKEALLVSSIVRRFFSELPLRRLVILLGRLLPLLRSATPGTPLLQA